MKKNPGARDALIIALTKSDPFSIAKNEVFRAGLAASVAVFGIAWIADSVFEGESARF
jgi:anaerobic C4-dicarboxylate transporter DcuB